MHLLSFLFTYLLFFRISTAVLTVADIETVVPKIIENTGALEETLEKYRATQVQIAASKLRSLLPPIEKFKGSAESSDDSEKEDSSDSDFEEIPTASSILTNSLNSILKSISDSTEADHIRTANFDQGALENFVTTKEQQAAQNLAESIESIKKIQQALALADRNIKITANLLARLVDKLDTLQDEYDDLDNIKKRLSSSKEDRRIKARKELVDSQAKIVKIVHKIAEILQEN